MPILTLEAIRENPWHVLSHTLPADPEPLLLEVAHLAADYCCRSEHMFMIAAREFPTMLLGGKSGEHMYEEHEARSCTADIKAEEVRDLYMKRFGLDLEEED